MTAVIYLLIAILSSADAMAKIFEQVGERAQDGQYFLILFATAALVLLNV